MPTILIYKFLSFYFYSFDVNEPGHVHITNNKSFVRAAKIWFDKEDIPGNIALFEKGSLTESEIKLSLKIVKANKKYLKSQWESFRKGQKVKMKVLNKI